MGKPKDPGKRAHLSVRRHGWDPEIRHVRSAVPLCVGSVTRAHTDRSSIRRRNRRITLWIKEQPFPFPLVLLIPRDEPILGLGIRYPAYIVTREPTPLAVHQEAVPPAGIELGEDFDDVSWCKGEC